VPTWGRLATTGYYAPWESLFKLNSEIEDALFYSKELDWNWLTNNLIP
jgi:hypothetical protein